MTDGGGGGGPPRKSIFFIVNGLRLQTQIPDKIAWVEIFQDFTKIGSVYYLKHITKMTLLQYIPYRWLDANQTTFLWLVIVWSTRVKYLKTV